MENHSPRITVRLCRFIIKRLSNQGSIAADRLRAAAAIDEAFALESLGDTAGSMAINDYVISAFAQSSDAEVRAHLAWAMVNKGWDLYLQDRYDEAITVYEDLSKSIPFEPPFMHPVAQGLMNCASVLGRTGRHVEEIAIYDRIAGALESAQTEAEAHLLRWALLRKAITLTEMHKYNEAVELCDSILSRWWDLSDWNTSTKVREFLAATVRHRAMAMFARGEFQVAIADVDRLLKRYLWSNESGLTEEVAWAMLGKAASLEALELPQEAMHTLDALVARFSRSRDEQVQAAVATARRRLEELE